MNKLLLIFLTLLQPLKAEDWSFRVPGITEIRDAEVRWYSSVESPSTITASGEHFYDSDFTFASRDLPFGTRIKITYKGRTGYFRCNDRGPNHVELTVGGFMWFENPKVGVLRGAVITILGD